MVATVAILVGTGEWANRPNLGLSCSGFLSVLLHWAASPLQHTKTQN